MSQDQVGRAPTTTTNRHAAATSLLLVVLCGVQFIDAFDVASMGPALPEIQQDLDMPPGSLQWIITAYVLGYGGLLLLGGRLADLFDRRKLLLAALAVFVVASVVGGLATSGEVLIAARLVKGVTAAFTAPAALAILLHTFADEHARAKALGTYISVSAVGFTSGLVLGGVLAAASWRLVLFVPATLAVVLLVAAVRVIPRPAATAGRGERQRVDVLGAVVVTAALLTLVYGVSRTAESGWGDGPTVGVLVAAVALLAAFVAIERSRRVPLVPLAIFGRAGLSRGNGAIFLLQGSYVAWQFLATLYLQNEHGWSPIEVGLVFAPGGLLVMLTAGWWAGRVTRYGAWPIASAGMVLMVVGTASTLALGTLDNALVFGVGSTIIGVGYAMCFPAANISAVAGARPDEQGLASGLFTASFQIGGGVVLGVVASVFAAAGTGAGAYRSGVTAAVAVALLALAVCLSGLRRRHEPGTPVITAVAGEPRPLGTAASPS
ncbi:MFS transporter [Blastococcus xanthinilyticus]|uniref:Putative MFS family arabinose efflux permease n=1 Tax=Blastococcus xanthinilyticus TaxID=1564164 RepID=A0A5S5D5U9_9ACTN|nr:MFS transporter [Blastococcus xanthinilyticus]TYP90516.1 putative MFS family arabinose efflux permease [Blastococcus xanthinilyticus]